MKILIKEGIVKKMVNRVLGYDLSDKIEMITNWEELDSRGKGMFPSKVRFNEMLNNWGPMFWIETPDNGKWLAQTRRDREWFIYQDYYNDQYGQRIDEDEFLDKLGIGFMGVKLQQIIDEFVTE